MKKTILFATIALTIATIVGCKKDETTTNPTTCKFEDANYLGSWKVTKVVRVSDGVDITEDYFTKEEPCDRNKVTIFKTNGIASFTVSGNDKNGKPCGGQEDITWKLLKENSVNYLVYQSTSTGSTPQKYIVSSATCTSLEFIASTVKYTMTKQ
jgi:hypothetical protein